jgi:hypothetical protein
VTSSSSSPNLHPLSSDFKVADDSSSPFSSISRDSSFDDMFLFGDGFDVSGGTWEHLPGEGTPSYNTFVEGPSASGTGVPSPSSHIPNPYFSPYDVSIRGISNSPFSSSFTPSTNDPFVPTSFDAYCHPNSLANVPSTHNTFPNTPVHIHNNGSFADWLPPPSAQHGLPSSVPHFPADIPFDSSFPFIPPSQNTRDFSIERAGQRHYNGARPFSNHSTPPMYTRHTSPYLAMTDGGYSPYHRSSSGSPGAFYSASPQHYPCGPVPPIPIRTSSSGSGASLYSSQSSHPSSAMLGISRTTSNCSDYNDYISSYSSPSSAVYTGSPSSISSAYGAIDGSYPVNNVSRNIPLPFPEHDTNWLNYPAV